MLVITKNFRIEYLENFSSTYGCRLKYNDLYIDHLLGIFCPKQSQSLTHPQSVDSPPCALMVAFILWGDWVGKMEPQTQLLNQKRS